MDCNRDVLSDRAIGSVLVVVSAPKAIAHSYFANFLDPPFNNSPIRPQGFALVARHVKTNGSNSPSDRYTPIDVHPCEDIAQTGQTSELSPYDLTKHFPVRRQVRDNLLQTLVLVLRRLKPAYLVRQQPTVLLLRVKICRLTNPNLPTSFRNRPTLLVLPRNEHPLRLSELRCFQATPLLFY